MTQIGSLHPPQSEVLQPDPINGFGNQHHRKADHKITKLDQLMPWPYAQSSAKQAMPNHPTPGTAGQSQTGVMALLKGHNR